jgi:hypothetical protein
MHFGMEDWMTCILLKPSQFAPTHKQPRKTLAPAPAIRMKRVNSSEEGNAEPWPGTSRRGDKTSCAEAPPQIRPTSALLPSNELSLAVQQQTLIRQHPISAKNPTDLSPSSEFLLISSQNEIKSLFYATSFYFRPREAEFEFLPIPWLSKRP